MKKILLLLLFILETITYATVDIRLVYVSNTRDFPSIGSSTLVFDVEAISNSGNIQIGGFQNAIQLDANFRAVYQASSFTNQLFPSPNYTTTQDYRSSDGRIRFIYTFDSGTRSTITTSFIRILTIAIQYATTPSDGSIAWFTGTPVYYVADGSNNDITGLELPIPIELVNIPLPVELTSFTSKYLNDRIQLNWITKTEVNNYGFNVERRINESEWNSICFVEGHGNSNSPKEYSYIDQDLFAGGSNFQYRLKQVDTDGSFEYSDVVEVEVVPNQYELSQNYPNPFNPSTTIRFSLPQASQLKINIYNMIGEQIATIADGMYEAGYHKVNFNASNSNLPSGAYIYRIESSDFVQVKKMILMK